MAETMTMAMPELFRDLVKKLLAAGVEAGLEYRPVGDLILYSVRQTVDHITQRLGAIAAHHADGDCWSRAN